MITYGFSIRGKSHIESGIVCQDSNKVVELTSGFYMGIVADGIGSAAHSDIGSDLAVRSLYSYCDDHIFQSMTESEIENVLLEGYTHALEQIEKYVKEHNEEISEYDTTLSAVIYDGKTVIYGHAGDGGIVIRCHDGNIKPITKRQKGADGISVRPLRSGSTSWEFGTVQEGVAAVLLVTDGMLDGVIQPVLVNLPQDHMSLVRKDFDNNNIYVTAAEFFMNPYDLYFNKTIKNPDIFMSHLLEGNLLKKDQDIFLDCIMAGYNRWFKKNEVIDLCNGIKKYYYAVWAISNVTDDKSIVCIMDEKANINPQDISFYQEPNWAWRQESYNALLYGQAMPPIPSDDPLYLDNKEEFSKEKTVISSDEQEEEKGYTNIEKTEDSVTSKMKKHVWIKKKKKLMLPAAIVICLLLGGVVGFMVHIGLSKNDKDVVTDTVTFADYENATNLEPSSTPNRGGEEVLGKQEIFSFLLFDYDLTQKLKSNKELQNKADKYLNSMKKLKVEDLSIEKRESFRKELEYYIICLFDSTDKKESNRIDKSGVGEDLVSVQDNSHFRKIKESGKAILDNDSYVDQMIEIMQEISESEQTKKFLTLLHDQLNEMGREDQVKIKENFDQITSE